MRGGIVSDIPARSNQFHANLRTGMDRHLRLLIAHCCCTGGVLAHNAKRVPMIGEELSGWGMGKMGRS